MKLVWTDDPQTEHHLSMIGLSWTRLDVPLSSIDVKMSLENNARLEKSLCQETVLDYACAMENGARFPSIVLRLNGNGKYRVLSGNHRVGSVEFLVDEGIIARDQAVFSGCYIVTSDDEAMLELVTRAANRWIGRRQGKAEVMEHAKFLMLKYNMGIAELSKHFCVPVQWLRGRLKAEEIRARLSDAGIPNTHLTDTQVAKLAQLQFNAKLEARTAAVAQEFELTNEQVRNLVDHVKAKAQDGEQAGMEALREVEKGYRATKLKAMPGTTAASRPYRARLMQHVNSLHNFLMCGNKGREFQSLDELQVANKHDRHELHEVWKLLKRKLDGLMHAAVCLDGKGK